MENIQIIIYKIIMSFFSKRFLNFQFKKFVHSPSIKFRGGINKQASEIASISSSHSNSSSHSGSRQPSTSIVDNLRAVEASLRYRTPLSSEEIEIINAGGPLKVGNWQKIRLKN
jgi:hypothetical protein